MSGAGDPITVAFDTIGRRVTLHGEPLALSSRELGVLEILLSRAGRVVSKDQLLEHLYSFSEEASSNAIEVYIHRVRKKIEPAGIIDVWRLPGLDGGQLTSGDLARGATVVVVWSTWSPRCRDIVPRVNRLASAWGGRARVVTVNFQEEPAAVREFLAGKGLAAPYVTKEELKIMLDAGRKAGAIEHEEVKMIKNVFQLHEITAEDAMRKLNASISELASRMNDLSATQASLAPVLHQLAGPLELRLVQGPPTSPSGNG